MVSTSAVLVGIDPSFKRTGISVYFGGTIVISECKTPPNKDKSFESVYRDAREQAVRVVKEVQSIKKDLVGQLSVPVYVISECPPPVGQFSPGLYALDTLLFDRMELNGWHVFRIYPTYILHFHGKRKFSKSESVDKAKDMMTKFRVELRSSRLSHDESESFIFLMRLVTRFGLQDKVNIDKYPALLSEKEKVLQ